jgi:hypothetical protein
MEKTPNSNAPTLKLVNGPAGRDYLYELFGRGHGPSKLRSMLLVVVICNPV